MFISFRLTLKVKSIASAPHHQHGGALGGGDCGSCSQLPGPRASQLGDTSAQPGGGSWVEGPIAELQ